MGRDDPVLTVTMPLRHYHYQYTYALPLPTRLTFGCGVIAFHFPSGVP